jgi:hypothetical protein
MHTHTTLVQAEAGLAGIGGENLVGSGFESEDPDAEFASDDFTVDAATPREG